jgi:hypothetical protein
MLYYLGSSCCSFVAVVVAGGRYKALRRDAPRKDFDSALDGDGDSSDGDETATADNTKT